jgi:hypothetical protein
LAEEEINYTKISETFFPETKHWQTVESAPIIENGKFTEIKGQLKTTFLASHIFEKLEEKDCSFITRALEEGNINSFRLIDVNSDGIKDIVYTGSAQCREGNVFLIWFATKNGFKVRQDIFWNVKVLKIYPVEKIQLSSVAAGCCGNPVDEYNLGNLNNIRFIKRVSTTFMTIQPTGTLINRPRFKSSKDTVLRSSPERKDSYDESLSGLQNRAVFGNVLSKFLPGITGVILAEHKDKLGRFWVYVLLDESSDLLRYHSPFLVNAGWIEKQTIKIIK